MNEFPIRRVRDLGQLIEAYDGFILDLWGTLHDGGRPYPGALELLGRLRRHRKPCVLLSNAPRRASQAVPRLTEMGIVPALYDGLETSGEAAWQALRSRGAADHEIGLLRRLGGRCYYIGKEVDRHMLAGIDLQAVPAIEQGDFILCAGLDATGATPEDYTALLQRGVAAGRPMLCINPDLVIHRSGVLEYCAGALAELYGRLGGEVLQFGKPHEAVYRRTLQLLAGIEPARLLAVGDSLRTDIAGANRQGIPSLLLACGIHAGEISRGDGGIDLAGLEAACRTLGARPDYVAPAIAAV